MATASKQLEVKTTPPSRKESTPRLPHEHDESHDSQATQPGPPRDDIKQAYKSTMNFGSGGGAKAKAWRDIWGAGQGVGLMDVCRPLRSWWSA
jgi:hypothetical protein